MRIIDDCDESFDRMRDDKLTDALDARKFSAITNAINELRAEKLKVYFEELENVNTDPSWLAEREQELRITESEWANYRAERNQRFVTQEF